MQMTKYRCPNRASAEIKISGEHVSDDNVSEKMGKTRGSYDYFLLICL